MPETAFFAPEIEELLREVASDPRSTLLRVPRPKVLRTFFEHDPVVSQHATGLRSAERELLRTHRDELAKLLREACVMKLYRHPLASQRKIRHDTANRIVDVPNERVWRERVWQERLHGRGPSPIEVTDLLDRCVEPEGLSSVCVARLASASLRLRSTTQARIYAAEAAFLDNHAQACLEFLTTAAAFNDGRALQASISCNRGAALAILDRLEDARVAYEAASNIDDPPLIAVVYWLVLSVNTEHAASALAAACALDGLVTGHHAGVDEAARGLRKQRAANSWVLGNSSRRLARVVWNKSGLAARKVIDAALS